MHDPNLTLRARDVARCLTYNGHAHEAQAKHLLLELALRLDARDIRVSKHGGLHLVNALGRRRPMTLKERLAWRLFGVLPALL